MRIHFFEHVSHLKVDPGLFLFSSFFNNRLKWLVWLVLAMLKVGASLACIIHVVQVNCHWKWIVVWWLLIIFDQHVAICFESTISFQLQILTCIYIHDLAPNSIKMRHMIFFYSCYERSSAYLIGFVGAKFWWIFYVGQVICWSAGFWWWYETWIWKTVYFYALCT